MTIELHDSLDGQVALVTGATRGIGAEIAAGLVDLGATVYAGARDTADITAPDQRAVALDVTDETEIREAVSRIRDETGRLDIAVNNAGVYPESGPIHEMDTADLDRTLTVNLRGPALVAKHVIPLVTEREGGRIINLSSGLGRFTDGQMGGSSPPYRLSKVGLGGLTAYLDAEYAADGLLANAVSPGWVRTDMGGSSARRSPEKGAETPVWLSRFQPSCPSGQLWKDQERITW
ncbi:MAG: dehydrogenase [uncultured archaeon A07HR60]|nr:MAG: dehydrogenase [uncultured archaeon A07HR60]